MSRVFKAGWVNVGSPKTIENNVITIVRNNIKSIEDEQKLNSEDNIKKRADDIISDAKQMYLNILQEANEEAKHVLEEAYAEADRLKQTEKRNGYTEGFETGYNDGKLKAEAIINEASQIREFLDLRKENIVKEMENEVISIILDISKKIIGEEISYNKDAIFSLIGQALMKCAYKNKLIIRVSKDEYDNVANNIDKIKAMVEGISDIEILSDMSLSTGGCVIDTPSGEINSSIDIQIKELEKAFLFMLRNE